MATSEADSGKTVSLAPGMLLAVTLRARLREGCGWRILQFDSSVLQALEAPDVEAEPKPAPNVAGFFSRETFRFRAKRAGETGLALAYVRPWERTPPEQQVRILVRTG